MKNGNIRLYKLLIRSEGSTRNHERVHARLLSLLSRLPNVRYGQLWCATHCTSGYKQH
jgi:hypothetical protein